MRVEVLNDSMEIGICVYNVMIMSVVSVLVYRFLPLQKMDVSFGVISISVFVCAVTTLLLVFVPKVWAHGNTINRQNSNEGMCVRACVRVCVRVFVCVCVRVLKCMLLVCVCACMRPNGAS